MSPTAVKEEKFELNRDTADIDLTSATPLTWYSQEPARLWSYEIPTGFSLVFSAEDVASLYIGGPNGECSAGIGIDVVIMDSSRQNVRNILNQCRYGDVKEFEDATKLKHLDISPGEQAIAREGEWVCLRFLRTVSIGGYYPEDAESYFRITCKRIRHTLYE